MSDAEMRIAVAEAIGVIDAQTANFFRKNPHALVHYPTVKDYPNRDYPTSLDACAEFERTLWPVDSMQWNHYVDRLLEACGDSEESPICATPYQRCEAFLKTRGLWKEGAR